MQIDVTTNRPALAALKQHQQAIDDDRARLANVEQILADQRKKLGEDRVSIPNLVALERAHSDALASIALGEADPGISVKTQAALDQAKAYFGELEQKAACTEITIKGLERKAAETKARISTMESEHGTKMEAFLMDELQVEALQYVETAKALIRGYSRMRALKSLAIRYNPTLAQRIGEGGGLVIGCWNLPAFKGLNQSHLDLGTMFDGGDRLAPRGRIAGWAEAEKKRIEAEVDVRFPSAADGVLFA